ncbi:MAG: DUF2938 domain-containing protein [Anaerolineales bacterium]|nr:DUF2938 domain-containing protein [Anaerolineales bacterium]
MNQLLALLGSAVVMGLGATLTFDLWALFLKHAFRMTPSNLCLVGRWLGYMPDGIFRHTNIAATPAKRAECAVGWTAHYLIGVTFALAFVAVVGQPWLRQPTPIPALLFGIITVLAPFFVMQPLMGLGWAASKTAQPTPARMRSLMNHAAFGVGLYLFALAVNGWSFFRA